MGHGHAHGGSRNRRDDGDSKGGPSKLTYAILIFLVAGGAIPLLMQVFDKLGAITGTGVYEAISPRDESRLRHVFFSGEPWLIWCNSPNELHPPESWRPHLDKLAELASSSSDPFRIGALDCTATLPSGKSTLERFSLSRYANTNSNNVNVILFANGERPTLVPGSVLQDLSRKPQEIVRYIHRQIKPRLPNISTTRELENRCVNRRTCGLILNMGGSINIDNSTTVHSYTASQLIRRYRNVAFAQIDLTKRHVDFLASKAMPPLNPGVTDEWPRFVMFSRIVKPFESEAEKQAREEVIAEHNKRRREIDQDGDNDQDEHDKTKSSTSSPSTSPLSAKVHRGEFDVDSISTLINQMLLETPSDSSFKPAFLPRNPKIVAPTRSSNAKKKQEKRREETKQEEFLEDVNEEQEEKPKKPSISKSKSKKEEESKKKEPSRSQREREAVRRAERRRADRARKSNDDQHEHHHHHEHHEHDHEHSHGGDSYEYHHDDDHDRGDERPSQQEEPDEIDLDSVSFDVDSHEHVQHDDL